MKSSPAGGLTHRRGAGAAWPVFYLNLGSIASLVRLGVGGLITSAGDSKKESVSPPCSVLRTSVPAGLSGNDEQANEGLNRITCRQCALNSE